MKAVLIDAYRHSDSVVLWLKAPENIRLQKQFSVKLYLEHSRLALSFLQKHKILYSEGVKKDYQGNRRKVYEITIKRIGNFESIVKRIEKETRHKLTMYNADIAPEQLFLYQNNLRPFGAVEIADDKIIPRDEEIQVPLEKASINIVKDSKIRAITLNGKVIEGDEKAVLKKFIKLFKDPDVILMEDAFSNLPFLAQRIAYHKLSCPFHRWDPKPIKYKGGKSFFSYGRVIYRHYAIKLNGRFLIDTNTQVGSECDIEAIVELSELSGTRFQQVASRSFGAVFQSALTRELVRKDCLVPFKEKPVDPPISMHDLIKADRTGYIFDSVTGYHEEVAEIDFSSLFPWIIYNYNISAETINPEALQPPSQKVPGLPFWISLSKKGVIPRAIKPMLDRRMEYKKNPTALNRARLQGLKWVLVTSYGYLRFREFKLGTAASHMIIGAYARELMMKAKELCEEKGYRIVHGITDSLYIQKKEITEKEVKELCREIELDTGIPMSFEGIFRWIVFLPSVNDITRPVATHYYGVFKSGDVKIRGTEVRQRGTSRIVKHFQKQILEIMSTCRSKEEILNNFPSFCSLLKDTLAILDYLKPEALESFITVSRTDYKNNIPQRIALEKLKRKGIRILPGQKVSYIHTAKGVALPEEYKGNPDNDKYKSLLVRSLFILIQPFGFIKEDILERIKNERQSRLTEYMPYCKAYLHPHNKAVQIK
jgi:DNA polymerase elongation subunit (family B)